MCAEPALPGYNQTLCGCSVFQTCPGSAQAHYLQHQALKNPKNPCQVTLAPALHLSAFPVQAAPYPEDPTPPLAVANKVNGVYKVNTDKVHPTVSHLPVLSLQVCSFLSHPAPSLRP